MRIPSDRDFTSRLRSAAVTARVGLWLGICFGLAFVTGLISHYAQLPDQPIPFPTSPAWGYRVTQGLHVISGTAAVPLLLVKLWTVYPRLFLRPPRALRAAVVDATERASIGVLVAGAVFLLASGLANSAQWYPWAFSFRTTHYAVGWITIGALVVHIAVKLPVIRHALGADVEDTVHDRPTSTEPGVLSRRGLLRTTWLATGVAVLVTAGSTVPVLRRVSVFGVRSGDGPAGIPINKSARAAGVTATATSSAYRLEVVRGASTLSFTRDQLLAMPQVTHDLPIACVEGWSASGSWTGVPVRSLLDLAGVPEGSDVRVVSLQQSGHYRETLLQANFADDPRTLLALALDGETLAVDHGYPARLIAPDRPGVLQTKWVTRLEVDA
ncbi:molybdopterin-dependent oxidoreductase [Nocardioides sp. LS1]|uniref:molybdopterin-dependent oxidoreductase n=1 Tax=Nocardioides sp. LS1 TaxID=1027620 RepID=UPI000FF995FD|nr:molybdopterin-dependent oxidoreductase [Nocardioides sp. LS1]GCD88731.1 molybdopterin-binding protein [Nocardioides sp. LS1]